MITILLSFAAIGAISSFYQIYKLVTFVQNKRAKRLSSWLAKKKKARRPAYFYKADDKDITAKSKNIYVY